MLKKLKRKLQLEFPLNHLYIIFRLLGITSYKRNKGRFKICYLTRLLSIPILIIISTSHYFLVTLLFKFYQGYLNIPIATAFLSYGIGCITSYVTLMIKNYKICGLMNEIVEMKKILQIENPVYKFGTSIRAITLFWSGFAIIIVYNVYDSISETGKYKYNNFWIQIMAVDVILIMILVMDVYFAEVLVTVRDLFKCFRHIFKVKKIQAMKISFNVMEFDKSQREQVIHAISLLHFYKRSHERLHGMREQINKNFGIVNFSSFTYTLIVLIFTAYSNVKRYANEPHEALKDALYFNTLYGWKLLALLDICTRLYEEDYKLSKQLHQYFLEYEDLYVQEEVQIFSLQLMHNQFQFDAGGFFDLNFTLALSIISVVATYTIILIQLQRDQDISQ